MIYPELPVVKTLSRTYNLIPISMEVYADMETPISLFKRFEGSSHCFLLESVEGGEKWARYSFIGRNPFLHIRGGNGVTLIVYKDGRQEERVGNPVAVLQELMTQYRSATVSGMPRFNGGAVGYFGYDLIRYFESLPAVPKDDLNVPECAFLFTDEVIVFDHFKQKMHIIVNLHVEADQDIADSYDKVLARLRAIYEEIRESRSRWVEGPASEVAAKSGSLTWTSNVTREEYCRNVEKGKAYIRNGDIFQVVLSQRLCVETDHSPFDVYRVLRVLNPSPYMYFLKFDDMILVGSSPERLCRVENGVVETCPIAGTRKRGKNAEEDAVLEKELLADQKELAEHRMLVDLARNDVGKVSKFGTVEVLDFMHVERYSHVMHIVTNVRGLLRPDKTPFEALMSIMPAGTLSGAPKIRAMEIIDELETVKRSTYGGAIGYLSFDGTLDSCITIRTVLFKGGKAYI